MRRGGEAQAREDCLVIGHETREHEGGVGVCRCDDKRESAGGEQGSDEAGSSGGPKGGAIGIPAHVICLLTTSGSLGKGRTFFGYRATCSQTRTSLVERDAEYS